ncbi:MAG: flagellar motor protein MotB [Gammaproteobacteria bacterium]|nr:flagellar motor protein MotB [Gammaproteobacteria bacterium]
MPTDKKQPIVVKKIKKGGHGHHGGAWKVAYADFVTAMMAFFLLLWLLSQTTQVVREGISDYFRNPTGIQGPGGASRSLIKLGGALEIAKGEKNKKQPEDVKPKHQVVVVNKKDEDKKRLDDLLVELKKAVQKSQALKPFKDQLLLDITPQGLRIQIVDKKNRPMFALGGTRLKPYTKKILRDLAKIINTVPNSIAISGHTDQKPFPKGYTRAYYDEDYAGKILYTNWELSADRANAARRELEKWGTKSSKITRVVGLASSVLFDKTRPRAPINRRIAIVVLNKEAENAIQIHEGKGQVKPKDIKNELRKKK